MTTTTRRAAPTDAAAECRAVQNALITGITYNVDGTIRDGHHRAAALAQQYGQPLPRTREDVDAILSMPARRTAGYKVGDVVGVPAEPPVGTVLRDGEPGSPDGFAEMVRQPDGWWYVRTDRNPVDGPFNWQAAFCVWNAGQSLTVVSLGDE